MSKSALGRGLGALMGGPATATHTPVTTVTALHAAATPETDSRERVQRVPLNRIRPCPFQPRKDFDEAALAELAASIKEQGIVQPLIVREQAGHLELIAGERRWRAAQLLGLAEVPVILRQADDRAVLELALIENLQRENLNPLEEAQGYSALINQFNLTQEEVAIKVGKSRAVVANALRLLKLPLPVQHYIRDGRLSVGHAKVILGLAGEKPQQQLADRVLKEALNVRQTEKLVARVQLRENDRPTKGTIAPLPTDAHVAALEEKLRERFGTKVNLRYKGGQGAVEILFYSDEDLNRVLDIAGVNLD